MGATYQTVGFAVLSEHRLKIKEQEKGVKYLNTVREL